MFSVHGWSVPPTHLKLQSSQLVESEHLMLSSTQQYQDKPKRKKSVRVQGSTLVTQNNLTELWERHVVKASGAGGKDTNVQIKDAVGLTEQQSPSAIVTVQSSDPSLIGRMTRTNGKRKAPSGQGNKHKKKIRSEKPPAIEGSVSPQPKPLAEAITSSDVQNPDNMATSRSLASHIISRPSGLPNLTSLQSGMRQKLTSARFRHLNELLYTTTSSSSANLFHTNPSFFTEYHEGFQRQVALWPENPVLAFISWALTRSGKISNVTPRPVGFRSQKSCFKVNAAQSMTNLPKSKPVLKTCNSDPHTQTDPLPRDRRSNLCTIADLGCGNAVFARTLCPKSKLLGLKIHSFDLCAPDPLITSADVSDVPLPDSSVDVAISCLALMGTNWLDFVEEAYRVLRWRGEYWIAEVASRFVARDQPTGISANDPKKNKGRRGRQRGGLEKKLVAGDEGYELGSWFSDDDDKNPGGTKSKMDSQKFLGPFVTVLKTRGFALVEEPEVGNKMFVRMRFKKSLTPTRGKRIPQVDYVQSHGFQPRRFFETSKSGEESISTEDEAKVLKPCIYKQR